MSRSLSPAVASTLVRAFVISRLDYCRAIYEGLPSCRVKCLDMVLRTAARLVGRIPRFGQSLDICGMSFTGSPTHSALSTGSLLWFGVAWRAWPHPISGNCVAPLLLFSVVSHYALLPRRSCWSPERGLLSDSAELSLWLVRRLGMISPLSSVWR